MKTKSMDMQNSFRGSDSKSSKERLGVVDFGREVKQELKKIEWTTKEELKSYTKIVVVSTFLFGMGVYLTDLGIQGFLGVINLLFKSIAG